MAQYGFFIDLSRCTGCNACVIACKQWYDIPPGPVKWIRVYQWEKGMFPDIDLRVLPIMCFHCENAPCIEACPHGAIYKEPKYGAVLVDADKCEGERKCWDSCPYGTPQFTGNDPGLKMSKCTMCIDRLENGAKPLCVLSCSLRALEFGTIDELKTKYGDTVNPGYIPKDYAPCRVQCPIGIDIENYINLITQGNFNEALNVIREQTNFVGVLGRVCRHPCEVDCLRGKFDDAVSIRSLHRFLADLELNVDKKKIASVKITKKEAVSIVGSGPAGLSCAYDLIRLGYPVTIFEANEESGGLLRYGIPGYTLPKEILDYEIRYLQELGIVIKTNTSIGKIEDMFSQGFKAVFIALGDGLSKKLGISGEDSKGIIYALHFIKQANIGLKMEMGKKIAVVGGGSVAVDAARLALRLGAQEVHLICFEHRDFTAKERMPAQDREIKEAEEEGVIIHPRSGIHTILSKDGEVAGVEIMRCLSVYDAEGNFAPVFEECITSTINVDNVVVAVGQEIDKSLFSQELYDDKGILVHPVTFETKIKGVFAGGDAVTGPADVVGAIATGKQAAISIDRYLSGKDLSTDRNKSSRTIAKRPGFKSIRPQSIELFKRNTFLEVIPGFTDDEAIEQANRCLRCGTYLPSVVIRPVDPKKQIVPWDFKRALELWQKRHPENGEEIPDVIDDISKVTQDLHDRTGRNTLVLKAKNVEELLENTMDDE